MAIRRRNNSRFEPTSEGITEQGQIDSLTPDHFDKDSTSTDEPHLSGAEAAAADDR
jgi:hypothetical protein